MSAIEQCRTATLGGHVLCCPACEHQDIAYNSCRNRHCPKCQASAAKRWLDARQADLLPVAYYPMVFTLPALISAIAYTNKALIYGLLFEIAAETLRTIAADPKHLGAQIGATLVLHTWGSALTHHPPVHGIVPGGGLSLDGERWISCKPGFFLSVRVLSRLFRRRFLEALSQAHAAGQLQFFGEYVNLTDASAFADWLANAGRRDHLAQVRELLKAAPAQEPKDVIKDVIADVPVKEVQPTFVCPECGGEMISVEILVRKPLIRAPPPQGGAP
jgi:hypothetical protein